MNWEPWLGCHKISEGCLNCYIHRANDRKNINTDFIMKSNDMNKPLIKNKDGSYKYKKGIIFTCFKSDFLLEEADEWRDEAFDIMRQRQDIQFLFLTKRIHRFKSIMPSDFHDNFKHVSVGVSVENQKQADARIAELKRLPINRKIVAVQPMLEEIELDHLLDTSIDLVVLGGETGKGSRPMKYEWVLKVRDACVKHNINFEFRQLSSVFVKDGKEYIIKRGEHSKQARKANINYRKV